MSDIELWIGIYSLVGMVIGLLISIIKFWYDLKKNNESLKVMSEMVNLYRKEVELLQRGLPEQISLQREKLALEREIHAAEERWKQMETLGKIAKFIIEND